MAKMAIISFLVLTTALVLSAALKERYPRLNLDRYFPSRSSTSTTNPFAFANAPEAVGTGSSSSSSNGDTRWFSMLHR